MTTKKCYSELMEIKSFKDRYEYLRLDGRVGDLTFNGRRYLNQMLYNSPEWRSFRRDIAIRDDGCDLAHEDHRIVKGCNLIVHHINPITVADILDRNPCIFDRENVILTTDNTHKAIHYGDGELLCDDLIIRTENDTCLWR